MMQHSTDAHTVHPNNPGKQSEHSALMNLVPVDQASHIAVQSGAWFDPATWGGEVPGTNAKVWIPENIQVEYDGISNQRLFTVRVDGTLDFATDTNTQVRLDTLVITPKGTLNIGSEESPVQGNVKTRIVISDNGAIDRNWDFQQLSRGVVSHGTVKIHGQAKTSHLQVKVDPKAGNSSLRLESTPKNWQVGDRIILTGTRYVPYQYDSQVGGLGDNGE